MGKLKRSSGVTPPKTDLDAMLGILNRSKTDYRVCYQFVEEINDYEIYIDVIFTVYTDDEECSDVSFELKFDSLGNVRTTSMEKVIE